MVLVVLLVLSIVLTSSFVTIASEHSGEYSSTVSNSRDIVKTVGPSAIFIRIEGVIDEAMLDYVKLGIAEAEKKNAPLIIELNTPGGYLDAAMNIVVEIDKASIPVISYVVEKWAESAGTMILVCSHVAAMQPGTVIGSMQPIEYNPAEGTYRPVNESKIINPILEFLSEHAGNKGRNITIIYKFVTQNLNLGAYEALDAGVIDIVAKNRAELLRKINNMTVYLPLQEITVRIVSDGSYEELKPTPRIMIAHTLSDPLISSLFMSLGMLIVLFSIISGHFYVLPIGVLLLLLGLIGSGFSINFTVAGLLVGGITLIVIELVTPGFGVIGVSGIIMLALGIAMLPVSGGFSITKEYAMTFLYAAYGIGLVLGGFFGILIYKVVKAKRQKPLIWGLEGKVGRALDEIKPGSQGFVVVDGEYWLATSSDHIKPGEKVLVLRKEGPRLIVRKTRS